MLDFLRSEGYFEANVRLDARPGARNPRAVDLYVDIDKGPSYPLGPDHVHRQPRAADRGDRPDVPPRRLVLRSGCARSPFTQKQLRLDIEALEKRYRELGYFGVRVTTDFSMQKSLDRVAKNVRLAIHDQRAQADHASRSRATTRSSSSTLRDELTLLTRGSYDDFEVGVQRRRHPALLPGGRLLLRARRLAPRAAVRRRGAHRLHDRRGARSCACAASSSPATSRCPPRELADVVSVRKYPPLGLGSGGYVTGKQMEQDVERIVEHYKSKGFLEAQGARRGGDVARRAGPAGRRRRRRRHRVARREEHLRALHDRGGPAADRSRARTSAPPSGEPLPYDKQFLLESVTTRPGDPYTPQAVHEDGRRLERLLGDAGYPSSSVDPGRQPQRRSRRA